MEPTELNFEHAVSVTEIPNGFWVACTCGYETGSHDEAEANDLAGLHHAETIG